MTRGDPKKECDQVRFSSVVAQIERVRRQVNISPLMETVGKGNISEMRALVNPLLLDIVEAVQHELTSRLFLHIPDDKKKYYSEDDRPLFGEDVAKTFKHSTYHISEAARCFALDRWDGCVYHLMLATEEALRQWGGSYKRKKKTPIVLVDWKVILDAAKTELDRLRNLPKTRAVDRRIQKLSEQLSHFGFIKDAYRNHVAHGREQYDERRAANLMHQVEAFMRSFVS